ncbi:MAG TPA: hypothetical protein VFE58_16875 [Tepidisphaeraceae bacterium]|nr:hypothetical protein [Tepidisphaeraceae bacterium]
MASKFPPMKDSELAAFTPAFSTKITASPTSFGLIAADATAFATVSTTWINAFNLANDPATRTAATIASKSLAKNTVLASLRSLAKRIQATPTVTAGQKESLGLPVHNAPHPILAPGFAPALTVVSAIGNVVRVRLDDATAPSRRGKPDDVAGAALFSFVGDVLPTDLTGWTSEGNTTRIVADIALPGSVLPGTKVWFCACWFSPRLQNGPACAGVPTRIPGGVALAA